MITNGIDLVLDAHATLSERAIFGNEQFNLELVLGQIGGDYHFGRGTLTIYNNMPGVSMHHSLVCHSYQPGRLMGLPLTTGRQGFYDNTLL